MRYNALLGNLQNLIDYQPSQAELSKILNVSRANISAKANRNSNIDDKDLALIEQFYNISFSQQNVVNNNLVNVSPLKASCGNGITIDTSLIEQYDINAQYALVVAKGTSMTPTINNEDICVIRKYDGNFIDGIYCFSIGDDMFIKRLSKNINQIVCTSDNPEFDKIVLKGDELDTIQILGKIVTVIRKF